MDHRRIRSLKERRELANYAKTLDLNRDFEELELISALLFDFDFRKVIPDLELIEKLRVILILRT